MDQHRSSQRDHLSKCGLLGTRRWDVARRSCGLPSHLTLVLSHKATVEILRLGLRVKELEGHVRTCTQVYRIPTIALKIVLRLGSGTQVNSSC